MVEIIKMRWANCYLLSGKNGSILIDSCNSEDGEQILSRIENKNVKLILLTHCHFDHVGSAEFLSKRLNIPIAMNEADTQLIGNGQASILKGNTFIGRIMSRHSSGILTKATYSVFTPDIFISDGQDLSEYGIAAHVVALPGHTKGSIGVLTDEGEFIVGDAMSNMLGPTGSPLFENEEMMKNSVNTIRKSGAKIIFVGHGNPIKL